MGETSGYMLAEAAEVAAGRIPRPKWVSIELPHSLLPRVMDGRWKKLMVFLGGQLLHDFDHHYCIEDSRLHLHEAPFHSVVIIDPMDGERWVFECGAWSKV